MVGLILLFLLIPLYYFRQCSIQVIFKDIQIPALARNEVYNIDNGKCIVTSKSTTQERVDLSAQKNIFLNQLTALPAIVKPTVTSSTFQPPLTRKIAPEDKDTVGYQFDFVGLSAVTDIILKDIQTSVDPKDSYYNRLIYTLNLSMQTTEST